MATVFNESNYESAILRLFQQRLGYTYIYGSDAVRDYHSPFTVYIYFKVINYFLLVIINTERNG